MYPSILIASLISKSGLIPAHILLDFRQRKYACHILSLPNSIPTKQILPITLQVGDGNARLEYLLEDDLIWASNQRITIYGQLLARQVSVEFSTDSTKGIKPI